MKKLCFILITLLMTLSTASSQENKEIIRTTSGLVSGIMQEGTMAWLGIPYAKVERFMPPQPVKKWKGVRKCDKWGPMTMQQQNRPMTEEQMSENCCVLNVWTTDVKAKKPVMFWLHGGGFDSGTSEWDPGMCLAKKDVVVVSINHRLNILGFLDLSTCGKKYKYSGNVGMLDAVQALEWVRDNIAKFGGDPDNVTIFGESGGGGKVGTLMCMPKAKGLFHKAIIMSGTILNVNTKAMTEELGEAVLKELGIDKKHVEKINKVSYKDLYAAGQRAMAASIGTRRPGTPMMWGFGPTPDGEVLLQQPFQPAFASISCSVRAMVRLFPSSRPAQNCSAPLAMRPMPISVHSWHPIHTIPSTVCHKICCASTGSSVPRPSSLLMPLEVSARPTPMSICTPSENLTTAVTKAPPTVPN